MNTPDARLRRRLAREREARLAAEEIAARVTRDLCARAELMHLLQRVAAHVCKTLGWPAGHVYQPILDGGGLVPTEIWYLDDPHRFAAFRDVTARTILPQGIGLAGRVAQDRHPAWVTDVAADAHGARAAVAVAAGLRGGVAVPVVVGAETVFVIELFTTHVVEPTPELTDAMVQIGGQLGRVVERERAAGALREREHAYRLLAENVTDVIFVYDMQFRPTYISPSAERLRGYTVEEMMAQSLAERLTPDSLARAMKLFNDIVTDPAMETAPSHESRIVDLEVKCKDGSTKWTETQMSFIRGDDGPRTRSSKSSSASRRRWTRSAAWPVASPTTSTTSSPSSRDARRCCSTSRPPTISRAASSRSSSRRASARRR
jgi:PAS domain S-box-containing protein